MSGETELKHLRGVEVIAETRRGLIPSYVVHVDRTKGITIHSIETDQPTSCINREEVLDCLKSRKDKNRVYHKGFSILLRQIESEEVVGNITFNPTFGVREEPANAGVGFACAYR